MKTPPPPPQQNLPVLKNPPLPQQGIADQFFQGGLTLATMPVRARIVQEFNAPDPWHGGVPAQWTLEVFQMVNRNALPAFVNGKATVRQKGTGGQTGTGEVLGLRNPAENRLRILPRALALLWQQGKVPTQQLPRLSALKERELTTDDYVRTTIPLNLTFFFLLPALLFVLVAGADWALNRNSPRELTPSQWLSRPVTSTGSIAMHEPIPIDGKLPIASVTIPSRMESATATGNVLVWYKAKEGERLALIGPLGAEPLLHSDAHDVSLEGPVIETSDLHLPADVIAGIRAQHPDLQAKYIVCHDWRWTMQDSPLGGIPLLWLGSAGVLALIWLLFYLRQVQAHRRLAQVQRSFEQAI